MTTCISKSLHKTRNTPCNLIFSFYMKQPPDFTRKDAKKKFQGRLLCLHGEELHEGSEQSLLVQQVDISVCPVSVFLLRNTLPVHT